MSRTKSWKVLLVEDESQMASIIRAIIRHDLGWEVVHVRDGQEAWEKVRAGHYDLIISDWNMPHKSGDALLREVRQHEDTHLLPFLMVTGLAQREQVLRAIDAGVSDYVVKPFSKKTLLDKIRRIVDEALPRSQPADTEVRPPTVLPAAFLGGAAQAQATSAHEPSPLAPSPPAPGGPAASHVRLVTEVVRHFTQGTLPLPVIPETACRIVAMLKEEVVDVAAIEPLLAADTSMTVHLLRVANSSHYSRGFASIVTLHEAIARLGVKQTLNHVFTLASRDLFRTQAPLFTDLFAKLWEHAVATGVCARRLAAHAGLPNAEVCFTLGLLHDIGKVVLADIMLAMATEQTAIDTTAIQYVFRALHEEVGATVLRQWHFPDDFPQVALYHHAISRLEEVTPELLVVHYANLVVRPLGYSLHAHEGTALTEVASAKRLGITAAHLQVITTEVCAEVEALTHLV